MRTPIFGRKIDGRDVLIYHELFPQGATLCIVAELSLAPIVQTQWWSARWHAFPPPFLVDDYILRTMYQGSLISEGIARDVFGHAVESWGAYV